MSQPSWIGKTLGERYQIVELLGQGGMSAVYKANDPNLRRVVAIKLIHGHLSNDPKFVMRFEEEAAAVAQLRHPNIIQVFDFANDGDTYYIVFEFVPGEKRHRLSGRRCAIEREQLIVAALFLEKNVCSVLERFERPLSEQGLAGTSNVLAEFRCPVHLVALRQVRPDLEYFAITQADTAAGRIVGCVRGFSEKLDAPVYFECRINCRARLLE